MPKDDPVHPPPLKRGDACLYCRKRRIRCSADKPTCQHCQKSGRECIYDSGKPVSRVKQLEEKVAQLENLLQSVTSGNIDPISNDVRRGSDNAGPSTSQQQQQLPHPPPLNHHSSSGTSTESYNMDTNTTYQQDNGTSTSFGYTTNSENFDINMFESILSSQPSIESSSNAIANTFASFGGSFFSGNSGIGAETGATANFFGMNNPSIDNTASGSGLGSGPNIESLFDFNMLDPNYFSMLNSFGSTSTGSSPATDPNMNSNPASFQQQASIPNLNSNNFYPETTPSAASSNISPSTQAGFPPSHSTSSSTNHHIPMPIGQYDSNTSEYPPYSNADTVGQNHPPSQPSSFANSTPSSSNPNVNLCDPEDIQKLANILSTNPAALGESNQRLAELIKSAQVQAPSEANSNIHSLLHQIDSTLGPSSGPEKYPPVGNVRNNQQWRDYEDPSPNPQQGDPIHDLLLQVENSVEPILGGGTGRIIDDVPTGLGGSIPTNDGYKDKEGFTLVGGWFDAHDLPKVARDHLLDLFFSGMRLFGQEFHVPRFMASLTLPLARRPHPCLLYTMYTLASRMSDSPPIRQLEPHFYKIASSQLEHSIGMADRLLDATRASTLLAIYKFSKAAYHEGWMMTGQAARLAVSCGLHQIHSSVFQKSSLPHIYGELSGIMRHRSYVLPPPQDAIELGERIWCFWSIYVTDRCGSISTQWPPAIADEVITTPFPRPLHEYELGLVTEQDDRHSVHSIYKLSAHHNPLPHYAETTLISIRLRSISILERASKLMYQQPEEGWENSLPFQPQSQPNTSTSTTSTSSSTHNSPSSNIDDYIYTQISFAAGHSPCYQRDLNATTYSGYSNKNNSSNTGGGGGGGSSSSSSSNLSKEGWTRTARIRTPKAFEEVKQALLKIESDLPPEWRVEWWKSDGKVQDWHFGKARKDLITLHFVLGCAWMFLYDVFSFKAENTDAINVAKRLTVTVRYVAKEAMSSDLDVFIAMTWSFISKILIREMKRLQSLGDMAGANAYEPDIQVLVTALKEFGQRYTIGTMQAMRAERYRKSTTEENDLLSKNKKKKNHKYKHKPTETNNQSQMNDEEDDILGENQDNSAGSESDSDNLDEEKYTFVGLIKDSLNETYVTMDLPKDRY